eukprot:TRINITY_DN57_c1_g1_i1.p1 TRINITY_DN57_c1_g1~~TRINITY_DN57_c1_g1_i1.p1  ORF type:complete len:335 (-),score=88.52 TRINITY_DN57_c1_g1_i1:45-1049(-)
MSDEALASPDRTGYAQGAGAGKHDYLSLEVAGGRDGQAVVDERRRKRWACHAGLLVGYLASGCLIYYFLEGWNPLQSLVFVLSIVTGVGYGHLVPSGELALVVTAAYIIAGLVVFATVAGQILDMVVQLEIEAAADLLHKGMSGGSDADSKLSYRKRCEQRRRDTFITGLVNVVVLYVFAICLFVFKYEESVGNATYLASLSVLKLDSICLLDGVHCSAGWHSSRGGEALDLLLAIFWYVLTYGIVGHFLVAASSYFGADPEPVMTKVESMTSTRFQRMDFDGDGKVKRSEFLRDRLIQGGIASAEAIDRILANFDELDKDGSGAVNMRDVSAR